VEEEPGVVSFNMVALPKGHHIKVNGLTRIPAHREEAMTEQEMLDAIREFVRVWRERSKYHFGDRELVAAVRPLLQIAGPS
jgi:hypothetical protein